jgi:hypothetical protein
MVAFTTRMPAGIAGDVNRSVANIIEAQIITPSGTTGAPTAYGVPMVVDATAGNIGNMRTMVSGDTAPYGLLMRPYPTGFAAQSSPLGTAGTPPSSGACDILVRGYMSVVLSNPTSAAVKGGPVYIWTAAASGAHIVGGFEAASSGSTILVANSYFMGPADSNNITEIAFNM